MVSPMNAYLLSLKPDIAALQQWDYGWLKRFFAGELWQTPDWENFNVIETDSIPKDKKAVVALPGRHHVGLESQISKQLQNIDHLILFLLSDEEAKFDVRKIASNHKKIYIWVQNPTPGKHDEFNKFGNGAPPQLDKYMPDDLPDKKLDVFFSGQVTHKRRHEMIQYLRQYKRDNDNVFIHESEGFTRGLSHQDYYNGMAAAKVATAPSGANVPGSFRLYEALECMAIPIADECNPQGTINSYWDWLFGEVTPIPKIVNYENLPGKIENKLKQFPKISHEVTAWYIKHKKDFAYKVMEQLNE